MAKRFTQTEKWKKDWYRELGSKWRDVWNFLLDDCNHAGIWEVSLANLHHFTGQRVTIAEIQEKFGNRVLYLADNKLFIRTFFEFQYGAAREGFRARQSALKELAKYGLVDENGLIKECFDISPECPEQSGVSPECASNSIGISTSIGTSKNAEDSKFDFSDLYKKYPRKRGKDEGMKRLRKRIVDQDTFDDFARAVHNYAEECRIEATEPRFMKHWSTFVGTDGDEPWLDYVEWQPSQYQMASGGGICGVIDV